MTPEQKLAKARERFQDEPLFQCNGCGHCAPYGTRVPPMPQMPQKCGTCGGEIWPVAGRSGSDDNG